MIRRIAIAAAASAALAAAPRPAAAATRTNTLSVTATVLGMCTIDAANLAFGNYSPADLADLDAAPVSITVRCTNGTTYSVDLGLGAHPTGTTRRMSGGATNSTDLLTYELYSDSGHTTAFPTTPVQGQQGQTTAPSHTASTAGAGTSAYTIQLYGRIPRGQSVAMGDYTDSVLMTVNF